MLFFKLTIFSILLLFSSLNGMQRPMPADLVREVAKKGIHSPNWSDQEKAFTVQSMALVNRQWLEALTRLKSQDFPYLSV